MNVSFQSRAARLLVVVSIAIILGALWPAWYVLQPRYYVWRLAREVQSDAEFPVRVMPKKIERMGERAVPALVARAKLGPSDVAKECMCLLGEIGGERAFSGLMEMLHSSDPELIDCAMGCLSSWWELDGSRARPLSPHLEEQLIGELLRAGDRALALLEEDPDKANLVLRILPNILSYFDDPRIVEWCKKMISSRDNMQPIRGLAAMQGCDARLVIPILQEALADEKYGVNRLVIQGWLNEKKGVESEEADIEILKPDADELLDEMDIFGEDPQEPSD